MKDHARFVFPKNFGMTVTYKKKEINENEFIFQALFEI